MNITGNNILGRSRESLEHYLIARTLTCNRSNFSSLRAMIKTKLWHMHTIFLLPMLLLILMCLQQMHLNVAALRDTEAQKFAFLTYARTNGACVDNFMRLWHEEMSAEEHAHWDGIWGLKLKYFNEFINNSMFSFKNGQFTVDISKFKLIEENSKEAWIFNLYIFNGFSFYFTPTGQISHRNMAKIVFLLAWQRLRLKANKEKHCCLSKRYFIAPRLYLCDLLNVAFKMPTAEEKTEMANRRAKKHEELLQKRQMPLHDKDETDLRAKFQRFFDQLHNDSRRTKLEAIFSLWQSGKFAYWSLLCPTDFKVDDTLSMALVNFAKNFIDTFSMEQQQQQQSTAIWRLRSYDEMKKILLDANDKEVWEKMQQIVYKQMEVYGGRRLTSFNVYEATELPLLLFMCLFKKGTGQLEMHTLLALLERSGDARRLGIFLERLRGGYYVKILMLKYRLSLAQMLDEWKPRWLLTADSVSGHYPMEEIPLERVPPVQIILDGKGKGKVEDHNNNNNMQIFMPIDDMRVEHMEFLLEAHENDDWKWSEVKPAPIADIYNEKILEFKFKIEKNSNKDAKTQHSPFVDIEDLIEYSNSQEEKHLTLRDWFTRSDQLFRLWHLTKMTPTNESEKTISNSSKKGSFSLSTLSVAQRLELVVQIYLRLFRTFVDKLREEQKVIQKMEWQRRRYNDEYNYRIKLNDLSKNTEIATRLGRKLIYFLVEKREADQQELDLFKSKPASDCDNGEATVAESDGAHNWIARKLAAHFATRPSGDGTSSSDTNLLTAASLLNDNDPCIEETTRWVRRLLRFDLEPAYKTSFTWKLLGLASVDDKKLVKTDFGESAMMKKLISGVSGGRLNRVKAQKNLKQMFEFVDTKVWQWAQRRLEAMFALLPQKREPLEHLQPEWAKEYKEKVGKKTQKIERTEYHVEALPLVRLFAYVQLGALIALNRLVAEMLWTDLMNGTRTLETTMLNTGEEHEPTKSLLEVRAKLINNLNSLYLYINESASDQEVIKVMGLQPIAIRPKQGNHHQEKGKSVFELAEIFGKHETLRTEMAKHGRKVEAKRLVKEEKKRKERESKSYHRGYHSTDGGKNMANFHKAMATSNPYNSPFYWMGYNDGLQAQGEHGTPADGDGGDSGGGEAVEIEFEFPDLDLDDTFGDIFDIFDYLPGFSDILDSLDWSEIFSTDGWSDVVDSALELAMNLFQEAQNMKLSDIGDWFALSDPGDVSGGCGLIDGMSNGVGGGADTKGCLDSCGDGGGDGGGGGVECTC